MVCQDSAMKILQALAQEDRHSVLIEGIHGCGKTHLSKMYATLIGAGDYQILVPKVSELKECIEQCARLDNKILICVENLDTGQPAASYAILKFLEEPQSHVYIVVTCRNMQRVPDTIVSRCATVSVSPPTADDLKSYGIATNSLKYSELENHKLMKCVRNFSDLDTVLEMKLDQLEYFNTLSQLSQFRDTVTNIVWKLGHYPDNTDTPIELVIRYIMELHPTKHIQLAGIECITSLLQQNIGAHAVLAKFVFECKYCE